MLALCYVSATRAVTIDTVSIGNPGNAADQDYGSGQFGAVAVSYRIGTTEITNAQYAEFLNAVAGAGDPYELYNTQMGSQTNGGINFSDSSGVNRFELKEDAVGQGPGGSDYTYADKPVVYVSWYSAIRFSNWLHNGQGSGDTESGAYTLLGGTPVPSNGLNIERNPGATWFLPSEDEWYKAAYHENDGVTGNYWLYPTSTDTVPNNNLPTEDTDNSANFFDSTFTTGDANYSMTDAGAYALSGSPYGTFDQGGNVFEWNETLISSSFRGLRGGAWVNGSVFLDASFRDFGFPDREDSVVGFRVASIVESIPGDANGDGVVDGLDYLVWVSNFGDDPADVPPGAPGNGDLNYDGLVDGLDYIVWAGNFGASDEPIPGDGNGDGHVDGLDYLIWAIHFGDDPAQDPPGSPENGDFNDDSKVDGLDYIIWVGNFSADTTVTVPEPTTLSLWVLAGMLAFRFDRRRR